MVEHYSKQIEVVAVPNKEPATIKRGVFLDRVISQYGCCAEVISDNGGEFKKEFRLRALVDTGRLGLMALVDTGGFRAQGPGRYRRSGVLVDTGCLGCWKLHDRGGT